MKHTYTIEVETGSDFQEQCITQMIDNFFTVLQTDLPYRHKKNKITITKN
jgi:hypothetical protein